MQFGHEDLMTHYSVELLFIIVAIGTFCHPFSMEKGWGSGLWPRARVYLEIFELHIINLHTDMNCL